MDLTPLLLTVFTSNNFDESHTEHYTQQWARTKDESSFHSRMPRTGKRVHHSNSSSSSIHTNEEDPFPPPPTCKRVILGSIGRTGKSRNNIVLPPSYEKARTIGTHHSLDAITSWFFNKHQSHSKFFYDHATRIIWLLLVQGQINSLVTLHQTVGNVIFLPTVWLHRKIRNPTMRAMGSTKLPTYAKWRKKKNYSIGNRCYTTQLNQG